MSLVAKLPVLASMFAQAVAASLVLLPFYVVADKHPLTLATAGMVLYAGIGASICAVLATILLGERPTAALLVGGGLTLAGVVVVELTQKAGRAPAVVEGTVAGRSQAT